MGVEILCDNRIHVKYNDAMLFELCDDFFYDLLCFTFLG